MSKPTIIQRAVLQALNVVEQARLDRPRIPPGSTRRRCGDVIRWKMNNQTVDQIIADLRRIYRLDEGKPSRRKQSARGR